MFYQVTGPPSPNGKVPRSSGNNPSSAGGDSKTRSVLVWPGLEMVGGLVQGPLGEWKGKGIESRRPTLKCICHFLAK